jgi:hypothetical protein
LDVKKPGRFLITAVISAALLATGCARKSANDITGQFTSFIRARDQAVQNAAAGKASLDPGLLNQMNICYNELRTKSGEYTDFVVSVIQSAAFDASQNQAAERNLEAAIASYNDCLLKLQKAAAAKNATSPMSLLDVDWVPVLGRAVESYWSRDGTMVRSLSPESKARLIDQIRTTAAWPDFATIGGIKPLDGR